MKTNDEPRLVSAPAGRAGEGRGAEPSWRALAGASAAAVVWVAGADGRVTAATGWEAATGLPAASVLGRGWLGALHPDDRPQAEAAWTAATAGATPCDLELRLRDANGGWRWRRVRGTPVHDPETGAVREWVGVAEDVEDRKRAEAALAAGEAAWRTLVEATPGLVFVTDDEGRNVFTNRRYQDYTGLPPEALLGDGWLATLHPEDRARAAGSWAASVRTGEPYEAEYRFLRADGEARWHLARGTPQRDPATGRIATWVGTCIDVDDSRRAEETNSRLAAIVASTSDAVVASTSDAVISFDAADGRILTWNNGAEALFGYTAEEAISGPVGLLVPPDLPDGDPTGVFRWAMEGRRVHEHETVRLAKGGERIPVSVTAARMLASDGRAIGVSAIFRDLRPRRAAEAALQRQTELLRTITDNVAEALFLMDVEGRVTFMNPAAERMLGWPQEKLLGRVLHDAVHHHRPDGTPYPAAECPLVQVFSTGRVLQAHEDTFFRRDGTALQVACSNAPVLAESGRVTGAVLAVHDITARRAAEAALAESQARLRETLATLDLGTAMARDLDGTIRYWSSGCARLYGWTAEEAVGRDAHELLRTAFPGARGDVDAALERHGEWTGDLRQRTRDGRELVVSARKVLRRGPDGRPTAVLEALTDVTAHRTAEAALARSEAALRTALDAIPQMVWSTRPDGFHDYYNRRWYEFTGAPPEQTEVEGWNPHFHPDDQERARARWRHSLQTGEPYEIEYRLRAADGPYRWVLGRALPVRDPRTGAITRWYGTCTEIDELLHTRAALAEALEVKDALLHEVNHRVKNSLQLVSSLLTLQASRARDGGLRAALSEARARIGVVARLHQRLYQTGAHGRVELVGFLRELCTDAAAALGAGDGRRVRLVFEPPAEAGELPLPIDRAVPLALVVSELLTNALKYAFPPDHSGGTVRVALRAAAASPGGDDGRVGALAVLVEDDGVGLPEGFAPAASTGVGMRVVTTLARQLAAELRIGQGVSGAGAAFELQMPERRT